MKARTVREANRERAVAKVAEGLAALSVDEIGAALMGAAKLVRVPGRRHPLADAALTYAERVADGRR